MSYRADFIISTIGMIFTNVAGFISFWIMFRNFPSINGRSYHEMLFLYGFSCGAPCHGSFAVSGLSRLFEKSLTKNFYYVQLLNNYIPKEKGSAAFYSD